MPAYMQIQGIEGNATDSKHDKWIIIESMTSPILRSIPAGARDQQRTQGETVLADVAIVRNVDKSTPKLTEACAKGKFFPEVKIDLCTTVKGESKPYMKYKLKNVIVTSHELHGTASGSPLPSETVCLNFTDIEWTYSDMDHKTGDAKGDVVTMYSPGQNK